MLMNRQRGSGRDGRGARVRRVGGRVMDYTDPLMFGPAYAVQVERRGSSVTHPFVVGEWRLHPDGTVRLWAVKTQPGYWIDLAAGLTSCQRGP